jgi:hypothetical protein
VGRSLVFAVASAGALIATAPSSAQLAVMVGAEFQVNSYTGGGQQRPAVASETNGDFVVVWDSQQGGSGTEVFGRRYTSGGTSIGTEFQINVQVGGNQWAPSVAMDADGDFVVAWHSGSSQDGSGYGVFGRRYASSGAAIGGEFRVNSYTYGFQSYPSVAMDTTGRFVVVWQSYYVDGSFFSIQTRRFDSSGSPQGTEVQANWTSQGNQILPAAAINDAGIFVAAWQSYGQDGDGYGAFALASAGDFTPTGEIMVNGYTLKDQRSARVGMTSDGGFVVVWSSEGYLDGDQDAVVFRRFSSTGLTAGYGIVNRFTLQEQYQPSIASSSTGSFIVAWTDEDADSSGSGIFARRFTSNDASFGPDLQVNAFTAFSQMRPAIALGGSRVAVAWDSPHDGDQTGVFARRALVSALLDIDGNGSLAPLTDGLLVLRHLFGFSGGSLTTAAVGAGCTRCTPAAITSYLIEVTGALDVDDSGTYQPLIDGLIILRYLFGFRGASLEVGAVSPNCDRCTAVEWEQFLAPYV